MLNEQDDYARQRNYWERMKAKLMLAMKWLVTPKVSVNHIQQMPQREL